MHEARPHTLDRKDSTDCRDGFLESAIDDVLSSEFQLRRQGMPSASSSENSQGNLGPDLSLILAINTIQTPRRIRFGEQRPRQRKSGRAVIESDSNEKTETPPPVTSTRRLRNDPFIPVTLNQRPT